MPVENILWKLVYRQLRRDEQMYTSPGTSTTSACTLPPCARQTDLSPCTVATESCGCTRYLRKLRNKWPTTTFLAWRTKRERISLSPSTLFHPTFIPRTARESGYLRICLYIAPNTYKCIFTSVINLCTYRLLLKFTT